MLSVRYACCGRMFHTADNTHRKMEREEEKKVIRNCETWRLLEIRDALWLHNAQCTRWMIWNIKHELWIWTWTFRAAYMFCFFFFLYESTSWWQESILVLLVILGYSTTTTTTFYIRIAYALNKLSEHSTSNHAFSFFVPFLFIYCMNIANKFLPGIVHERCYCNCFWRIFMTGNHFHHIHFIALPVPGTVDHRRWNWHSVFQRFSSFLNRAICLSLE